MKTRFILGWPRFACVISFVISLDVVSQEVKQETRIGEREVLVATNRVVAVVREQSSYKPDRKKPSFMELFWGAVSLFATGRPGTQVQTPYANAGAINTEYEVLVESNGPRRTLVRVFDGTVRLWNTNGTVEVASGQVGIAEEGQTPRILETNQVSPQFALLATNRVQWWLYYPAILDTRELQFSPDEAANFAQSLDAWRRGNLRAAGREFPTTLPQLTDAGRTYYAALRLAAGEAGDASALLNQVQADSPTVRGLRELIAVVAHTDMVTNDPGKSATAWLGRSFWLQARTGMTNRLELARDAALQAVAYSPTNGLALARLAELEFSLGRLRRAREALDKALANSPEHAAAYAMRGFVLAAENRIDEARLSFDKARDLDPMLPEGWLGSGLLWFRAGEKRAGLDDIQAAALVGGNRSLLRSYLGKAFAETYDIKHAQAQLELARGLDPNDPTPWLYSALDLYAQNRVNEAIADLERSLKLNDNRAVYRSQLLLDQDRAVRATSLARLYLRAGMPEVALREAAHAVSYDYANPSAHLFLADSFNALRDPTRFNLRYETAWFNELLLANALAPVDSGILSPGLTHQEYTRLFARDGFFLSSFGEARSDGQFRQLATQSGVFGRSAYAVDLDFQHNDGVRPNNDLERIEVYAQIKQQISRTDTALLLTKFQDYESGDNFQYRDPANPRPHFRFDERQEPIAIGIWRHEWSPGHQTLALAGRLENDQRFRDLGTTKTVLVGSPANPQDLLLDLAYRGRFETYMGELNHIAQFNSNTLVAGGRVQVGEFTTSDRLTGDPRVSSFFGDTAGTGVFHDAVIGEEFSRLSLYAYDTWQALERLSFTAGLQYDTLDSPRNFRHPPISGGSVDQSRLLPKAALIWRPTDSLSVRGMFAQSLGGVSFDESYRLEPVQLAGFSQAFRTVIPESIVGSVSGHRLDLGGLALDVKLPTRTFLGAQATITRSAVDRTLGLFEFDPSFSWAPPGQPGQTIEFLRYEEQAIQFTVNQLVGANWSFGGKYELSRAQLDRDIPSMTFTSAEEADMHTLRLQALFNAANGWFGRAMALWWWQKDSGEINGVARIAAEHDEQHAQFDLEAGWRFPRQYGELSLGVMNLLDDDYRLAPLSAVSELPRERVFFVRLRLNL
ncbi:MAG: TonB-dependent receptor [Verrucomicrobia bacterium]|nr:TonB-dependent receptor [Verrucomicrobiota bacterium]